MFRCMTVLTIMMTGAPIALAQAQESRDIVLHATIRDPAGLPVPDIAVAIRDDAEPTRKASHAYFDSEGKLVSTISVPSDASYLILMLVPAIQASTNHSETQAIMTRFRALQNTVSFRPQYRIPLLADHQTYSITLQAAPSVTVSGRLVDPSGAPLGGSVRTRNSWGSTGMHAPTDGNFILKGVASGVPTDLVCTSSGHIAHIRPLSAEETSDSLDLGDIVLHPVQPQCPISVHVDPSTTGYITLINITTMDMIGFVVNRDGSLMPSGGTTEAVAVPEGDYVLAAGWPSIDDTVFLLYDLVRGNHIAAHPELPKLEARLNQTESITIDPADVRAKVRSAARIQGFPVD